MTKKEIIISFIDTMRNKGISEDEKLDDDCRVADFVLDMMGFPQDTSTKFDLSTGKPKSGFKGELRCRDLWTEIVYDKNKTGTQIYSLLEKEYEEVDPKDFIPLTDSNENLIYLLQRIYSRFDGGDYLMYGGYHECIKDVGYILGIKIDDEEDKTTDTK